MLPRELYAPPAGEDNAQWILVSYLDSARTREEVWYTTRTSDAPRQHRRRLSGDNGRTWSDFESIEAHVNVQRPDGGMVTYPGPVHVDLTSGRCYRVRMRRMWSGQELYSYTSLGATRDPGYNDHVWIVEDEKEEKLLRYEEGPEFDPGDPFVPAFRVTNRAYFGSGMTFGADGTAYHPIVCYKSGTNDGERAAGVRLMRRDPVSGDWLASEPQYIRPEFSSRGLLEPDVALLRDGRLLVVCRGSNTPTTPGRKWACLSTDGGRTLSPVEELRYDDGSSFYSPSSIHRFFRSRRNGRLYWMANIVPEPPKGSRPRYPLWIAEVDEAKAAICRNRLILVDDRREGDSDLVQLSNWSQLENRETLDWEFYLTRLGEHAERPWGSGVYRYIFSPPS